MPTAARKSKATRPGPVIPLGRDLAAPEAVVAVPGNQIPLLRLDLPPGLRGQAREQVAVRQLADRTGLSPDSLSLRPFVPAGTGSSGQGHARWSRVLVADRQWLQGLESLTCRAVLPDYLTLPTAAGIWSLQLAQSTADPSSNPGPNPGSHPDPSPNSRPSPVMVARLGPEDGFSAQPAIALALLRQALAVPDPERSPPRAILWQGSAEARLLAEIKALAAAHDIALIEEPAAARALGLPQPESFAHSELDCDLRHNPMAARARLAATVLPWRWPLLAACLAAGLWATGQLVQLNQLQTAALAQEERNQALVRRHFVASGPVLDARLQVSRALAELRKNSGATEGKADPLHLAAPLAAVLSAAGLQPDLLSYRSDAGLVLALRLSDFAEADQLAEALRAAGLTTALTDSRVSEAESSVQAEFLITGLEAQP
ncbi:type II secretion system protein GspL [Pseudophaeobacter sp.]|uniref:type II secretion system protein GspL n=1 Tax=Pseudophaeobacter sp. TaxID=1971739 RepID=UPI003299BA6D